MVNDPVLDQLIAIEFFTTAAGVALNALDGFEHVAEPLARVPHNATAS